MDLIEQHCVCQNPVEKLRCMNAPYTQIDEAETHKVINAKLSSAGWAVQDKSRLNLHAASAVAVLMIKPHPFICTIPQVVSP